MKRRWHSFWFFLGCLLLVACAGESEYETPQLPPPPPPPPATAPAELPEPYAATTPGPSAGVEIGAASPPPAAPPPADSPPAAATPPPVPQAEAPQAPPVYTYASGQWVYMAGRGWVWVPAGATTVETDGVPYVYLYTPSYGWTWYVSPWGWGPYHYGVWIRHPWHPVGRHGYWVAHPHVIVRLGPGWHHHR